MLREQGMAEGKTTPKPTGKFWSIVGGASGGAMGFIFANFPGAVAVRLFTLSLRKGQAFEPYLYYLCSIINAFFFLPSKQGAVAGNRVGAIRDARGKSVYSVFQELPQADKAKLLSELAAKVFSHAVGTS